MMKQKIRLVSRIEKYDICRYIMVTFTADELLTIMRQVQFPSKSTGTGKQTNRKTIRLFDIAGDVNHFNG